MTALQRPLTRRQLRGFSIVPMLTPFTAGGAVDEPAARRLIEHIIGGGCQGILAAGTTGEAASMPLAERIRLVQITVGQVGGRGVVFGGIGDNSLSHSVELAREYFGAGADAVVAHLPSYYPIEGAGMEYHFLSLADRVEGPLYLYNIPQTTRHSLPLEVIERLSRHARIAGIKDSEADGVRQERLARRFAGRTDFAVFCGSIPYTAQAMRAGADGFVPSAGNVAPGVARELMDRWVAGDEVDAARLQERIGAISAIYQRGRNVPQSLCAMKGILEIMGLGARHMLPPLQACTDTEVAELRRQLQAEQLVA